MVRKVLRDGYADYKDDPDAYAYTIVCHACAAEGGWAKSESGACRWWNRRAALSGEPAPTVSQEAPAAWAIIEDGAVVGLRIARGDADSAAQAWNRPPLVAPLFLRSALSGGIPRSVNEDDVQALHAADSDLRFMACGGTVDSTTMAGHAANLIDLAKRLRSGGIPRTDSEEPKRDTWARQHFPNGVDLRSSESTLSDEERATITDARAQADAGRVRSEDVEALLAIIDRLQRVPSPDAPRVSWDGDTGTRT